MKFRPRDGLNIEKSNGSFWTAVAMVSVDIVGAG